MLNKTGWIRIKKANKKVVGIKEVKNNNKKSRTKKKQLLRLLHVSCAFSFDVQSIKIKLKKEKDRSKREKNIYLRQVGSNIFFLLRIYLFHIKNDHGN